MAIVLSALGEDGIKQFGIMIGMIIPIINVLCVSTLIWFSEEKIETAKRLKDSPNEIYFVFTVQEEVGCRGAGTSAYAIEPNLGLAVDVTRTGDTPESAIMEVALGKGAAIKVKDSGLLTHPKVRAYLVQLAKEKGIAYQMEVLESGGTDAGPMQRSRGGVMAGAVSIPTRYLHSPSEMVDIDDTEACVALLTALLEKDLRSEGF